MRAVFIVPLAGLLLWGSAVFAQNGKDEKTATEEILEILRDKGEISDSNYEELKEKAENERESDPSAINPYWKKGFGFKNQIGDFEIDIGGRTFMQRSLPVNAFSPGRNTGLMIFDFFLNERMSWALGTFYETDDFGNDFDDITDINVTGRLTGAPVYADEGRKVVHLGLIYSHRFRDEEEEDAGVQYRVRPSTRITDARLANTGDILVDDFDLVDLEAALVLGPFL